MKILLKPQSINTRQRKYTAFRVKAVLTSPEGTKKKSPELFRILIAGEAKPAEGIVEDSREFCLNVKIPVNMSMSDGKNVPGAGGGGRASPDGSR